LMLSMIGELGHQVDKLVLTEVRDHTYFAELSLDGGEYTVSCRPSDGVAVAIRAGAQIFAESALVEEVGREVAAEATETEEIIDDFREFINNINPEDFGQ
jgi:bifunctional DNase/RNase